MTPAQKQTLRDIHAILRASTDEKAKALTDKLIEARTNPVMPGK